MARLRDQEISAKWVINNPKQKMAAISGVVLGRTQLVPRKVLLESDWLKFGEFSYVGIRMYPSGDEASSRCEFYVQHPNRSDCEHSAEIVAVHRHALPPGCSMVAN